MFLIPKPSKIPVALASLAFSAFFATAASKALAHGCVVREETQTSEKVAGYDLKLTEGKWLQDIEYADARLSTRA